MSVLLLSPRTCTGTPSEPFPGSVFQHSEQPCEGPRPQQSGALTQVPPVTPFETFHLKKEPLKNQTFEQKGNSFETKPTFGST